MRTRTSRRRSPSRPPSPSTSPTCFAFRKANGSPSGSAPPPALPNTLSSAIRARRRWKARSNARKNHAVNGAPERVRIITVGGAFHGRTLATLAAGGQKKYLEGFGPVVEGFNQVPFGDLAATKRAVTAETAAILIAPTM